MTPGAQSMSRQRVSSHQTHLTPISTDRPKKSIQQYNIGAVNVLLVPFYDRKRCHLPLCEASACLQDALI